MHSVVLDPADKQRMYVAISAGGVYRTNDGGSNWSAQNRGIRAMFMPDKYPEFGQCVHKIAIHPGRPERLFLQNHWGLYRSDNCAESWTDIANGVPSDFGFTVLVHPRNPDCVYVVPVESDEFRCACDGRLRVYRTRNGGASWEPLVRGLPQKRAYETVLRDAMTAIPSVFTSVHAAGSFLARAMKAGRGKRYSTGCHPWSAYGTQFLRVPLDYGQRRIRLHPHLNLDQGSLRRASRGQRTGRAQQKRDDRADNLSHSGRFARIYCRARPS